MRILVFSDSHGRVGPMQDMVELYAPDAVFHLGDVVRDGDKLQALYPKLPFYRVAGNCDWSASGLPLESVAYLEGKTVFYMHGHTQHVKTGIGLAVKAAQAVQAQLLLFGHTHRAVCKQKNGVWLVNPGTIGGVGAAATYAVAEAENGSVSVELKEL